MGRDDWYRNKIWNAEVEAAFRAKLSRSRSSRFQYLWIQASCLADQYPHVALGLIDEYFQIDSGFDVPSAYCVRAEAYKTLDQTGQALAAYKAALEWESAHPNFVSLARIDAPKLIADHRLSNEYLFALDILANRFEQSDWSEPRIFLQI